MADTKEYIIYEENRGSVNISEEVVAIIAGNAALEVDGVEGLYTYPGRNISDFIGKKSLAKAVKIKVGEEGMTANIFILTGTGVSIGKVGAEVQAAVKSAVEASTGLKVLTVNVHVCGVSLKKR